MIWKKKNRDVIKQIMQGGRKDLETQREGKAENTIFKKSKLHPAGEMSMEASRKPEFPLWSCSKENFPPEFNQGCQSWLSVHQG